MGVSALLFPATLPAPPKSYPNTSYPAPTAPTAPHLLALWGAPTHLLWVTEADFPLCRAGWVPIHDQQWLIEASKRKSLC